ncbi:MAG: hypothetical protein IJA07_02765 [Agathobacter sp.]|nr:hypothetical protein [Agathobacter sp.]
MKEVTKDILVFTFLASLIYLRINYADASWVGIVSYIGILIALGDLFSECVYEYRDRVGFGLFFWICILGAIILIVVCANIFVGQIVVDTIGMDVLTFLALIISLPHKLYVKLLGFLLKKKRKEEKNEYK